MVVAVPPSIGVDNTGDKTGELVTETIGAFVGGDGAVGPDGGVYVHCFLSLHKVHWDSCTASSSDWTLEYALRNTVYLIGP